MDQKRLVAMLPSQSTLNGMTASEKKIRAEAVIEAVLQAIAADGREPDKWEAVALSFAMTSCRCGMYVLAMTEVANALIEPSFRSEAANRTWPEFTSEDLHNELRYTKGVPVRVR